MKLNKIITKISFSFYFFFLNVATRTFRTIPVAGFVFLWDSPALSPSVSILEEFICGK